MSNKEMSQPLYNFKFEESVKIQVDADFRGKTSILEVKGPGNLLKFKDDNFIVVATKDGQISMVDRDYVRSINLDVKD